MALVITNYLDIQDGDFGPAETWYVGLDSINSGSNFNVFFENIPTFNVIEGLTISETSTSFVIANSALSAIDKVVYGTATGFGSATGLGVGFQSAIGQTFIANKSGPVNTFTVRGYVPPNPISPTTNGSIEIWQLATNSINSSPQTLVYSRTLPWSEVAVQSPTPDLGQLFSFPVDYTLTQGVGYAMVIRAGTDWDYQNTNTLQPANYGLDQSSIFYKNYYSSLYRQVRFINSWTTLDLASFIGELYYSEPVDSEINVLDASVSTTETGTSVDNSDRVISLRRFTSEPSSGDGAVELMKLGFGGSGYGVTPTSGTGVSFIAPRTGRLGTIRAQTSNQIVTATPQRTTTAKIQLWSLSSNSITATPSVKLAEVDLPWQDFGTITETLLGDFSNTVNADVIAGNAYAVLVVGGSDWSTSVGAATVVLWGSYNLETMGPVVNDYKYYRYDFQTTQFLNPTLLPHIDVDYATTNTDVQNNVITTTQAIAETGTVDDAETTVITANSWISEEYIQQNLISDAIGYAATGLSNSTRKYGQSFIANRTGVLGTVQLGLYRSNTIQPLPSDDGTIELWQLQSNSITALPQTQLASVPMNLASLGTSDANIANYYFGNITLTQGVGYAIVIVPPSTGSASTQYPSFTFATNTLDSVTQRFYNYFIQFNNSMLRFTLGSWGIDAGRLLRVVVAVENATEVSLGNYTTSALLSETGTATETEDRLLTRRSRSDEAPGGLLVSAIVTTSGSSGSTGETYVGVKFIATQTTQLGDIYGSYYRNGSGLPTGTLGALELWQLSSASITATVQTKIAEVPFDLRDVTTSTASKMNFMGSFLSNSNAVVTEGNAYAVIFVQAADWDFQTSQRLYDFSTISNDVLRSLPYTYIQGGTRDALLSSTQFGKGWKIEPAFKNAQEQSVNIITTTQAIAETGTISDSPSSLRLARAYAQDPEIVLDTYLGASFNTSSNNNFIGTGYVDTGANPSVTFTASKTCELSTIQIGLFKQSAGVTFADFSIDLYQGALLVASKTITSNSLPTATGIQISVLGNGFNVTAGVTYKLQVTTNPAWVDLARPILVYWDPRASSWQPDRYNYLPTTGITYGQNARFIVKLIAKTVDDLVLSTFDTSVIASETGNADETEDQLVTALRDITETGDGTDSQFNITSFETQLIETGVGNDSQFNIFITAPQLITESADATDPDTIGGLLSLAELSETGNADETESNLVSFVSDLTETGNAAESETNLVSFVTQLTETGTSSDITSLLSLTARAYLTNTTPFANSISNVTYAIGNPISAGLPVARGIRFISNKTEVLGNIGISAYRILTQNSAPTTTGIVEVWQLASNSITATPSTLIASKTINYTDLPSSGLSSIAPITNTLVGSTGLTQYVSANADDAFVQLANIPWGVNYLGNTYSTVYVGSNSYLTFGTGASTYNPLSASAPTVPKICISSADNSYQQVFAGIEGTAPNRTYRIRYEGTNNTSGTVGSPNMVWEMVLYENNTSQIDIQIGANARGAGGSLHGIYTQDALVGSLTDISGSTTYANIGWRIVSNADIVSQKNISYFDLSSLNATLNSGTAYLVGIRSGSDWDRTKQFWGIYSLHTLAVGTASSLGSPAVLSAQVLEYNYLYPSVYYPATTSGAWTSISNDNLLYSFAVYSTTDFLNTVDTLVGGLLSLAELSETGSADETESNLVSFVSDLTETGTGADSQFNIVSFETQLVETGELLDSQFNVFTTNQFLTETGTATETETSSALFVSQLTETGTANNTESNLVSFATVLIESGSLTDSQFNIASFDTRLIETGELLDSQFNIATRLADITETGELLDSQFNIATRLADITETGIGADSQFNLVAFLSLITESGNATETEDRLVTAFRSLIETGNSDDSQFNVFTTNQFLTETVSADETESNIVSFVSDLSETALTSVIESNIVTFLTLTTETADASDSEFNIATRVADLTETNISSDNQFNTAIRIADLIELLTTTDLSSAQAAFISAIQEAIEAADAGSNIITTNQNISEIIESLDNQTSFAFLVGDISELINAITQENGQPAAFLSENVNSTTLELAQTLVQRGVLEQVFAVDLLPRPTVAYAVAIREINAAGESVVAWVFFPMDYELVTSKYSAAIQIQSDEIYMDNIDVFYADDDNIIANAFVEYDQIYIDDIDVLYGNLARIDDVSDDEIYI